MTTEEATAFPILTEAAQLHVRAHEEVQKHLEWLDRELELVRGQVESLATEVKHDEPS